MKKKRLWLLSILLAVFIPFSFAFAGDAPRSLEDRVPGEILIGFGPDVTSSQIQAVVTSIGGQVTGEVNLPDVKIRRVKLSSTAPSAIDSAINSIKTDRTFQDKIKYVEPNIIQKIFGGASILSQSSDPLLSEQWGYYDIGANWLNASTAAAPIIAVIDTGVDYNHPDLKGKVIKGYDYVNSDADPMDDHGHGTHVSGIAAAIANNAYGIAGVSWNSKILAIKACNPQGDCSGFDIIQGIYDAANYPGVKVINMSLGGAYSPDEEEAVAYAVNTKGKLLVAAAGNGDTSTPSYPAGLSVTYTNKVLAVAAHGDDGHGLGDHCKATFSNYGDWVSITAPGVDILSTVPNSMGTNGFASWNGTSMASPFVAGAAAVAWAYYPKSKNTDIASLITTNTDTVVRDGTCWPNGPDDGTFQRLDLVNMLFPSFYTACDNRAIYGFALNAENGEPLSGAKVQTTYGTSVTGTDFVPYYGILNDPPGDAILGDGYEGYGFFSLALNYPSTPKSPQNLKIIKTGFAKPTLPVAITQCDNYAGNIPVPPNKSKYWLAVTWDYGYTDSSYYSVLYVSGYDVYVDYVDPGNLNDIPWAKHLWNSWYGEGNLRDFSEVIRIKKTVSGTYLFYVVDFGIGAGSTSWADSGIKAYIYKWDSATLTQKLVKTYTPPAGPTDAGQFWVICTIDGNTITDQNFLTD